MDSESLEAIFAHNLAVNIDRVIREQGSELLLGDGPLDYIGGMFQFTLAQYLEEVAEGRRPSKSSPSLKIHTCRQRDHLVQLSYQGVQKFKELHDVDLMANWATFVTIFSKMYPNKRLVKYTQ